MRDEKTVHGRSGEAEGQWRAQALVRNRETGGSGTLSLDIIAREPSWMRIEVMGAFGVHVASIALNGDTVQYLLSRAERFVEAPAEMSLSGLAPVEVAPADLLRLLFDRPLPESEWQCGTDVPRQRARECVHRSSSLRIEWLERDGGKRRLEIESAQASVEMVLREARSNVEVGPEAFQLRPPPGYKVETYRR